MEPKWPLHQKHLGARWTQGASNQGVGRSYAYIHRHEWGALHRDLPQSQPIGLTRSPYITSLMRGDDTTMVARQHRLLEERQNLVKLEIGCSAGDAHVWL